MLVCYFITPSINEAKDSLNEQLWTVLHLSTIVLTLVTLILNILMTILGSTNYSITELKTSKILFLNLW